MKRSWFVIAAAIPLVAIGSIVVWQLAGSDRTVGALSGPTAPVALSWRGDWSAQVAYGPGDLVSHEGAGFIAESESTGSAPDPQCASACPWILFPSGAPRLETGSGAGGAGTGGAPLAVSPSQHDFGSVSVGSNALFVFDVTTSGLTIAGVESSSSDFIVAATTGTPTHQAVTVFFAPSETSSRTAELTVTTIAGQTVETTDDGQEIVTTEPGEVVVVPLSGTGVKPS
jgi:hypothetical protein